MITVNFEKLIDLYKDLHECDDKKKLLLKEFAFDVVRCYKDIVNNIKVEK